MNPLQIQIIQKRHDPPTNTNNTKTTRTPTNTNNTKTTFVFVGARVVFV